MLLTLSCAATSHGPATDLGFLLGKHPDRCQSFPLPRGRAHVFYPEAGAERCTAALLVELDPVALFRGKGRRGEALAPHYTSDRPYACSSQLSVAIARVLGGALAGRCPQRPELAEAALPLEATLCALPCRRGDEDLPQRLFAPLGYELELEPLALHPAAEAEGPAPYAVLRLRGRLRLRDLLRHLYVLLPVLDRRKHYWVGSDEVDKLLRFGEGWLERHPERELVARRALRAQRFLVREALARLADEAGCDTAAAERAARAEEDRLEAGLRLADERVVAVCAVLRELGARTVADLGCGEGRLLAALADEPGLDRVLGFDANPWILERAAVRLRLGERAPDARPRLELVQGALSYRDPRLEGFDAAVLAEVIEHVDPPRLPACERTVFGAARPRAVVVTTPNREYNARFAGLAPGALRHRDHRFEWTRAEFRAWAEAVANRFGYAVELRSVGPEDPSLGPPCQMGVFRRDA
ncbi:MAG: 3' terminal RNA ribose 2'-O-methyltransferase Hen1 [Planctomycetota bacterium]|nr:MAG: 3' terminal RNA ribose 2'-O-methyltransferase Hen1 [Planctomycetota bacterium]